MPIEWWLYPAFGIVAGLLAGLLGVGGGLVLVAGLTWLLPREGVPVDASMHAALATSLATIVITGLASARAHNRRGSVLWPSVFWLLPGLLIGGWLGGARGRHVECLRRWHRPGQRAWLCDAFAIAADAARQLGLCLFAGGDRHRGYLDAVRTIWRAACASLERAGLETDFRGVLARG